MEFDFLQTIEILLKYFFLVEKDKIDSSDTSHPSQTLNQIYQINKIQQK